MPKTVKQLKEEFSMEKYDVKGFTVKIADSRTGEYYDIDSIGLDTEAEEVYLTVNKEIEE